ncbi:MAG: hypothetical protein D6722_29445 [Bacteroidetes bacterium]|nr:MAG: hypothetical protein D6722_29445 [Bacteroidota bacterium]
MLLLAGAGHFLSPAFLLGFFPDWVPYPTFWIYLSGMAELILGIGLLWPRWRRAAAGLSSLMFLVYLPLHIRDLVIETPVVGSEMAAWVRLPIQFVLIAWAWYVFHRTAPTAPSAE